MRRSFVALLLLFCLAPVASAADVPSKPAPPSTRRDNVQDVMHGVTVADPYRWLEDQNSPETRAWINAQNAYTHSLLASVPGRDKIEKRLTELRSVDTTGLLVPPPRSK